MEQGLGAPGRKGHQPAIMVLGHPPPVGAQPFRVLQVGPVIAQMQHQPVRYKALAYQVQGQLIRHFPNNQPRLLCCIGMLEHLP